MNSFFNTNATEINIARIKYFDILGFDLSGKSVLEVGCGARGDFTKMLLDNGCHVTSQDARVQNLTSLKNKFGDTIQYAAYDLNKPDVIHHKYDFILCFGLLYHLDRPDIGIRNMSLNGRSLLISSIVDPAHGIGLRLEREDVNNFNQSFTGRGCRPTRHWIMNELNKYYKHVFISLKQPNNKEFPIDWRNLTYSPEKVNTRAVFFATNDDTMVIDHKIWSKEISDINYY